MKPGALCLLCSAPMSDKPNTDLGERFPRTAEQAADLRTQGDAAARDLCAFLDQSPTPFHAAREAAARLAAAGFREISEQESWDLAPGKGHYILRGGSTLIAFVTGTEPPAEGGFRMIGAHTDSPNLRIKPNADLSRSGFQQVAVEVYGGVLLSTWLDRDLSIAGRVLCRSAGAPGGVEARLVDLARPVARVPNLAIHLNRGVNKEGLVLNEQRHMVPVVGLGKEAVLRAAIARALEESRRATSSATTSPSTTPRRRPSAAWAASSSSPRASTTSRAATPPSPRSRRSPRGRARPPASSRSTTTRSAGAGAPSARRAACCATRWRGSSRHARRALRRWSR